MFRRFRQLFQRSEKPSQERLVIRLGQVEGLLAGLEGAIPTVQQVRNEFRQLTRKVPLDAQGTVDENAWKQKPIAEQREIYDDLGQLLSKLSRDDLKIGMHWFWGVCVFLVIILGIYILLHWASPASSSVDRCSVLNIYNALAKMRASVETLEGIADVNSRDFTAITSATNSLRQQLLGVAVSFQTLSILGTVEGDIERKAIPRRDDIEKLARTVSSDLEALHGDVFWSDSKRRWFEIAFWAELGVLVGLVFYIAGQFGERSFKVDDVPMFVAEVIIAPPVVVVIFFLFEFTGITEIKPGETMTTVNLGLAFILGFAIRRTLGLLDNIKRRLLPPPPSTSSSSPQPAEQSSRGDGAS